MSRQGPTPLPGPGGGSTHIHIPLVLPCTRTLQDKDQKDTAHPAFSIKHNQLTVILCRSNNSNNKVIHQSFNNKAQWRLVKHKSWRRRRRVNHQRVLARSRQVIIILANLSYSNIFTSPRLFTQSNMHSHFPSAYAHDNSKENSLWRKEHDTK